MDGADYNLRLFAPLAAYLAADPQRRAGFEARCEPLGVLPAHFDDKTRWVSLGVAEAVLQAARDLMDSEEEFRRACCHGMVPPFASTFFGWATSPERAYAGLPRTVPSVTTAGTMDVLSVTSRSARVRYTSKYKEGRLLCVSRLAHATALPTMFGLRPARAREHTCIALGDAACEYELVWVNRPRWIWPLVGASCALVAARLGLQEPLALSASLGLLAGLAFVVAEQGRLARERERAMADLSTELHGRVAEEAEVRRELVARRERDHEWARLLSQSEADRQAAIDAVSEMLSDLKVERQNTLRDIGHGLRNPLTAISANAALLREADDLPEEHRSVVRELTENSARMSRMIKDMVDVLRPPPFVARRPSRVHTAPLVETIRRRATALVFQKDVRVHVFASRECPESLDVDSFALDRVIDNVMTISAELTERGSLVVELGGVPDHVVLKIADTGRGLSTEELERVLDHARERSTTPPPTSYGVGLTAVVELLGRMGGRLEVMSQAAVGTTFWLYLPVVPPSKAASTAVEERRGTPQLELVRVRKA